ncbi:MAG: Re/Si-specific NAD(P)(+) transhydrogenase subunit alpha [Chloroflexota bacterium]
MDDSSQSHSSVVVGVPVERVAGERRVALVPEIVQKLTDIGITVLIESGAGESASFEDEAFVSAGAEIEARPGEVFRRADILVKVQPPAPQEIDLLRRGALVLSFLDPSRDARVVPLLEERGVIAFSFNAVPRITRAQSMDAMSSMSTVAGYKAVLLAANALGRFFPMLMTAAGTVAPARVVVIGAGVAGLQALATARRLGAVTAACDARPAVAEQIQSVGATFIDMSVPMESAEGEGGYARAMDEEIYQRERDAIREHIEGADVVISTALVPGARAPFLIDEAMVQAMRHGSVIVDLAAEAGGNCELTTPGETVSVHGVTIVGLLNVPSTVPVHASQMYARNVLSVIKHVVTASDGQATLHLDPDDEIVRSACLTGMAGVRAG